MKEDRGPLSMRNKTPNLSNLEKYKPCLQGPVCLNNKETLLTKYVMNIQLVLFC